ncbi:hypothetical protein ACHAXM_002030 [Skeletonema potamos]
MVVMDMMRQKARATETKRYNQGQRLINILRYLSPFHKYLESAMESIIPSSRHEKFVTSSSGDKRSSTSS